jgi:hypothetical protein
MGCVSSKPEIDDINITKSQTTSIQKTNTTRKTKTK